MLLLFVFMCSCLEVDRQDEFFLKPRLHIMSWGPTFMKIKAEKLFTSRMALNPLIILIWLKPRLHFAVETTSLLTACSRGLSSFGGLLFSPLALTVSVYFLMPLPLDFQAWRKCRVPALPLLHISPHTPLANWKAAGFWYWQGTADICLPEFVF